MAAPQGRPPLRTPNPTKVLFQDFRSSAGWTSSIRVVFWNSISLALGAPPPLPEWSRGREKETCHLSQPPSCSSLGNSMYQLTQLGPHLPCQPASQPACPSLFPQARRDACPNRHPSHGEATPALPHACARMDTHTHHTQYTAGISPPPVHNPLEGEEGIV